MKPHLSYAVLAIALVLAGWLAGSRQPVEAQTTPGTGYAAHGEWVMHSDGADFIYNTVTGVIYRIYTGCGDAAPDGCVRGPLPITAGAVTITEAGTEMGLDPNAIRTIQP